MLASETPANISVCRSVVGEGQISCADTDTDRIELRQEGYEFEEVNALSEGCGDCYEVHTKWPVQICKSRRRQEH
jgi:hypothetical protein